MKFTPKSKEELQKDLLLKEGVHKLTVIKAEEKVSKKGFMMIELDLQGTNDERKLVTIKDWLVDQNLSKLLGFCEATNLLDEYNSGTLESYHCLNKTLWAEIEIPAPQENPKGGFYRLKNAIKFYVTENNVPLAHKDPEFVSQDVPF